MKSMMKLIGIVALLTAFSTACCENGLPDNEAGETDVFVPVTDVTGIKTSVTVGTTYLSGTVVPSNATNKTIRWYVVSDEDTGGTINGNILNTIADGTIVIRATIVDGLAGGKKFSKKFTIFVDPFVPVKSINPRFSGPSKMGNDLYKVGDLYLDGIVNPYDASYTDIVWTVKDAGTTLARIKNGDDTLTTRAAGTVWITATIINGKADGINYTQDFSIDIDDVSESP